MVRSQAWAFAPAWILFAMSFFRPLGLEIIVALSILAGSLAFGLCFGFFLARHISSKADTTGVYRRPAPPLAVVITACAAIPVLVFVLIFAFNFSLAQMAALFWIETLTVWGIATTMPLGTLLFERRARSRLWILWIPSPCRLNGSNTILSTTLEGDVRGSRHPSQVGPAFVLVTLSR